MSGRRLLLILCLAAASWGQDQDWEWGCDPVKEQQRVDIDKVVGRWYVAATNIPGLTDANMCFGIEYLRSNNSYDLILQQYMGSPDKFGPVSKSTVTVIAPSKWRGGGYTMAVVDMPLDGKTLAVIVCAKSTVEDNRKFVQTTVVLSKTKTPALEPINARLQEAGVESLNKQTLFKLAACPNDYL